MPRRGTKKQKTKNKKNETQTKVRMVLISHYQLIRYESSCGHKIEGVTPKQTGNEHGQTKQNKINKQGRKQTEGSGRESSLQRTSSPGRDSKEKTKKQKTNKAKQTKDNHI